MRQLSLRSDRSHRSRTLLACFQRGRRVALDPVVPRQAAACTHPLSATVAYRRTILGSSIWNFPIKQHSLSYYECPASIRILRRDCLLAIDGAGHRRLKDTYGAHSAHPSSDTKATKATVPTMAHGSRLLPPAVGMACARPFPVRTSVEFELPIERPTRPNLPVTIISRLLSHRNIPLAKIGRLEGTSAWAFGTPVGSAETTLFCACPA